MTKSPKTAETPSWRTLMRRAKTAPRIEAKQLREQAASLRRAERATTKKAAVSNKRRLEAMRVVASIPEPATLGGINRIPSSSWQNQNGQTPGHGEIVGGEVSKMAETLAALARKKGGTDAVQAELARLIAIARYEGQKAGDDANAKGYLATREAIDEKIVCGFIAEVDMAQQRYRGLPPDMVWNLNSFTITKIVDALNRAGYTAKGRKNS